jgi:hypothetical protein
MFPPRADLLSFDGDKSPHKSGDKSPHSTAPARHQARQRALSSGVPDGVAFFRLESR